MVMIPEIIYITLVSTNPVVDKIEPPSTLVCFSNGNDFIGDKDLFSRRNTTLRGRETA